MEFSIKIIDKLIVSPRFTVALYSGVEKTLLLYLYCTMQSSTQFFIRYYLKKHLGFLWSSAIGDTDIFWKNFFRLNKAMPVDVLEESPKRLLLKSTVDNKHFQCYVRNAPSSDIFVFRQIFETKEYMPLVKLIERNNDCSMIKLIVDAGANVGYTAIFFNLFFSEAQVVAIEPDGLNAEQISLNFAANNITHTEVLVAGLWSHDCWLKLYKDKSKGQEWGFHVKESTMPTSLRAIDILTLPQLSNGDKIDILKIDIEGSEAKLFEDREKASQILSITRYLAIEIHDDMADRLYIQQVLKDNNFTWFEEGELTIAFNKNLISV